MSLISFIQKINVSLSHFLQYRNQIFDAYKSHEKYSQLNIADKTAHKLEKIIRFVTHKKKVFLNYEIYTSTGSFLMYEIYVS